MGTVKRVDSPMLVKLEALAKEADRWQTKVGWFAGNNYPNGTSVAYVGAIMEHGAPSVGVPPRPYFRPTIDARRQEWARLMAGYSRMAVKGAITIKEAFDAVGGHAVGDVQKAMSQLSEPKLSDVTMMLRKFTKLGGLDGIDGTPPVTSYKQVAQARDLVNKAKAKGESLNFAGVSSNPLDFTGKLITTMSFVTGEKDKS